MRQKNGHRQLCLFPPEGVTLKGVPEEIRGELIGLLSRLMISVVEKDAIAGEKGHQKREVDNG